MRKMGQRSNAPFFVAQNDPTARGLPKAPGQKTPLASRACVPRRGLHRRKQGVIFQTETYGPGSMPKQRRARMSKLYSYGLTHKIDMPGSEGGLGRSFDGEADVTAANAKFLKTKMREIVSFLRQLDAAKTPEARALILSESKLVTFARLLASIFTGADISSMMASQIQADLTAVGTVMSADLTAAGTVMSAAGTAIASIIPSVSTLSSGAMSGGRVVGSILGKMAEIGLRLTLGGFPVVPTPSGRPPPPIPQAALLAEIQSGKKLKTKPPPLGSPMTSPRIPTPPPPPFARPPTPLLMPSPPVDPSVKKREPVQLIKKERSQSMGDLMAVGAELHAAVQRSPELFALPDIGIVSAVLPAARDVVEEEEEEEEVEGSGLQPTPPVATRTRTFTQVQTEQSRREKADADHIKRIRKERGLS